MWLWIACVNPDAPVVPGDEASFVLEVPKGATGNGLTDALVSEGLVPGKWSWKLFLRSTDLSCLKAGGHAVSRSMSLNELAHALCTSPLAEDVAFTVVEGWRISDIDAALAAAGLLPAGAYAEIARNPAKVQAPFAITSPTLEGYLYPETYRVKPGERLATDLILRQLDTFKERFLDTHPVGDLSLHDVVVVASLLEREEPNPANRVLVSGIVHNRLKAGSALGVDATSRYTLKDWNDRTAFLKNLRDPDDPYNTRLRKGLPPTAIGNPALASLEAALAPQATEFWYYLHDANGVLHPAVDAAGHEANRRTYDVW